MGISVVTPTLNEANYIKAWCENVLQFSDDVIVLDCGSTDGTPDIVTQYPVNLVIFKQPWEPYRWNEGIVRNKLLDEATGKWIMPLDADELFDDNLVNELPKLCESRKDFITFPIVQLWLHTNTRRVGDIRKGFWDWKRFDPSRRIRMFRNKSSIRYHNMIQLVHKHTHIEYRGLGKHSWRLSYHNADVPFIHYHACGQPKVNENRKPDMEKSGIRLETYFGPHPKAKELIRGLQA